MSMADMGRRGLRMDFRTNQASGRMKSLQKAIGLRVKKCVGGTCTGRGAGQTGGELGPVALEFAWIQDRKDRKDRTACSADMSPREGTHPSCGTRLNGIRGRIVESWICGFVHQENAAAFA